MPRRRHRQAPPARAALGSGWQWRTFPVLFAFVCGLFVMGLVGGTPAGWLVFLASLGGMGFGLAHILTRQIALRRAQRLSRRGAAPPPIAGTEETVTPPPARRRGRRG